MAYWRPIHAVRLADTDGNAATVPDPTWTPLAVTPPYPEYPSGHACITGVATETLDELFDDDALDLTLVSFVSPSPGAPAVPVTRGYDSTDVLDRDTMNARIWLGLHFRKAMVDANRLGHRVAGWAVEHFFEPTHDGGDRTDRDDG